MPGAGVVAAEKEAMNYRFLSIARKVIRDFQFSS